jgi:hypothetical protein
MGYFAGGSTNGSDKSYALHETRLRCRRISPQGPGAEETLTMHYIGLVRSSHRLCSDLTLCSGYTGCFKNRSGSLNSEGGL